MPDGENSRVPSVSLPVSHCDRRLRGSRRNACFLSLTLQLRHVNFGSSNSLSVYVPSQACLPELKDDTCMLLFLFFFFGVVASHVFVNTVNIQCTHCLCNFRSRKTPRSRMYNNRTFKHCFRFICTVISKLRGTSFRPETKERLVGGVLYLKLYFSMGRAGDRFFFYFETGLEKRMPNNAFCGYLFETIPPISLFAGRP